MELIGAFWTGIKLIPAAFIISVVAMICMKIIYGKTSWKLFVKTLLCSIYFMGILNVTGITYRFHSIDEIMSGNYLLPNLVLFRYLTTWDMLLNIIMMIPLGFIMMEAKKMNFWKAAVVGILITATIESIQFMQGRCFDINDIFFNEIGTIVGVVLHIIYRCVRKPGK